MSSGKGIFIVVLVATVSITTSCKLDIQTLCETVKDDLGLPIDLSSKCTCEASKTVCDLINKGAPYDFATLCPVIGTALIGQAPQSCSCTAFNKTCTKINECNAAHAATMKSSMVNVMPSSSSSVVMMESSSMMMANKTTGEEDMMSTTMITSSSSSQSSMMADKTPVPEPASSSSSMMMMSSSVVAKANGTSKDTSSANQIQVGYAAVSFCSLMAVLFYYIM